MEDNYDYRQTTMTADEYAAELALDSAKDVARYLIYTQDERVYDTQPTTDPFVLLARKIYHSKYIN